jgi:iron complex transport system ATP-binding protein
MSAVIEIRNASFRYGDAVVYENIDLSLERGEILCLLGPNGCGKTTLLDTVLGFHRPRTGSILVEGREIHTYRRAELAKRMAYVPQIHEKYFPYSVLDVVVMGRTPHLPAMSPPSAGDYALAREALDAVGISGLGDRIYTTLSGGETQLAVLARALAQDAPVIIMDEPASHLDFRHEHVLLRLVSKLVAEKGLSVIMSTHSPNHPFYLENAGAPVRVALMNDRRIMALGFPDRVINARNMKRLYGIVSRVFENAVPEGKMKYVVPLNGLTERSK